MKKITAFGLCLLSLGIGTTTVKFLMDKELKKKSDKTDKFKTYYNMLNHWLILYQEGKSIATYFENKQYLKIAIYGMGEIGCRLNEELLKSKIEVKFAIDKNAKGTYSEIDVFDIDSDLELEEVDVIVVTPSFAFYEIKETLEKKFSCDIISLEDILYEL